MTVEFGVRRRAALIGLAAMMTVMTGLVGVSSTSAGFVDVTYAAARLRTESPPALPVSYDQSFGSSLFLSRFGELFVAGYRGTGDGAGGLTTSASAPPTRVVFPEGVVIVDAAGSTDDFTSAQALTTSFAALDSAGRVWTWGAVLPGGDVGRSLIGRGPLSAQAAATPGQVSSTSDPAVPLPKIVDIARSENQFFALDGSGKLWVWGYGGQNLPLPDGSVASRTAPTMSNTTGALPGRGSCKAGMPNHAGEVVWHSLWGGTNSSGAVATNGLVYTWGYDNSDGVSALILDTGCPTLNQGANEALFAAYPHLYRAADGSTFSPDALRTREARNVRYRAIVANMVSRTLPECDGTKASGQVDSGPCPVRQLGFSARAPRLLLQNGTMLTWQVSAEYFGKTFLGRTSSLTPLSSNYVFSPAPVTIDGSTDSVDRFTAGISSVLVLTKTGRAFGWGDNNLCQAVGGGWDDVSRRAIPLVCSTDAPSRVVTLPAPVQGLPAAPLQAIAATQCAAWVTTTSGEVYAWGAGTAAGWNFTRCMPRTAAVAGYRVYDYAASSAQSPFGTPIPVVSTGTTRVRAE
ncbi:hypothetical protein [Plantibacter flavus]|uniref:hypothetical protein n=1 Tax=Plantibacter flavus TaxID=150123 RepID=UPI0012947755|nr:hypothetical protein [Plantibacter flavus]